MSNKKTHLRRLSLSNSSNNELVVWLEQGEVEEYRIEPKCEVEVRALIVTRGQGDVDSLEWTVVVDAPNNTMSVYVPGELESVQDFYIVNSLTLLRLHPVAPQQA